MTDPNQTSYSDEIFSLWECTPIALHCGSVIFNMVVKVAEIK